MKLLYIVVLVFFQFGCSSSDGNGEQADRLAVRSMPATMSAEELIKQIHIQVMGTSPKSLEALIRSQNDSLMLAAAWERVRQADTRMGPNGIARLNDHALSRFIGVIEGRLNITLPDPWVETVLTARRRKEGYIVFDVAQVIRAAKSTSQPRGMTLARTNGQWVVSTNGRSYSVPAEDSFGHVDKATIIAQSDVVYVALFTWPPKPYRVHASNDGRVLWSTTVFTAGDIITYDGQGIHEAYLLFRDDHLIACGVSGNVAYIEVFAAATGDSVCRFSTLFFDPQMKEYLHLTGG